MNVSSNSPPPASEAAADPVPTPESISGASTLGPPTSPGRLSCRKGPATASASTGSASRRRLIRHLDGVARETGTPSRNPRRIPSKGSRVGGSQVPGEGAPGPPGQPGGTLTHLSVPALGSSGHRPPPESFHLVGAPGEPGFQNGRKNSEASNAAAAYYKDHEGIVHVRGFVTKGTFSGDLPSSRWLSPSGGHGGRRSAGLCRRDDLRRRQHGSQRGRGSRRGSRT